MHVGDLDMNYYLSSSINIPIGSNVDKATHLVAKVHNLDVKDIYSCTLYRQSVDARRKDNVHFVCSYIFSTKKIVKDAKPYIPPVDVIDTAIKKSNNKHIVVIGAGPAGLFCALYLCKSGAKVTVIERGEDIKDRQKSVNIFFNGGKLNTNSNVQFGLGGAGTFSDGKLTTGISSPLVYTVFNQFVAHGAPSSIMTDALPHIGTDKLVEVVDNLKSTIQSLGGKFLFNTTVIDFLTTDGNVDGVRVQSGQDCYNISADCVVLACGHSARDTFSSLYKLGAEMHIKPFAVGVRIEHSRQFINQAQYGKLFATHKDLPAASYKLVYNGDTHSCYSFCMCPGGSVVAATSQQNCVVVNGMSDYARDAVNSNSALVVNVTPKDLEEWGYGTDSLAGVRFQEHLEQKAFQMGGGNYTAPMQSVKDFLGVASNEEKYPSVNPSYPRKTSAANLWDLFPDSICKTLSDGLLYFDNKIKGFASHGILTAVESRTSSPVRIVRNTNLESNLSNLYPTGEGAGYSGGIVSSAVDGIKVASAILNK